MRSQPRAPTETPNWRRTHLEQRDIFWPEHGLDFEAELVPDTKPRQFDEPGISIAVRKKRHECVSVKWADNDSEARLRIAKTLPKHGRDPELIVLPRPADACEHLRVHEDRLADKLLDADWHVEVVREQILHGASRSRMLREQPRVVQQHFVAHV